MKKILIFVFLSLAVLQSANVFAQTDKGLLTGKDLSTVDVDSMTESDIRMIKNQMEGYGVSMEQMGPIVLQKGMKQAEYEKLKRRMGEAGKNSGGEDDDDGIETSTSSELAKRTFSKPSVKDSINRAKAGRGEKEIGGFDPNLIFGYELFTNAELTFESNLNIPTPKDYILGPDDKLTIGVYGTQQFETKVLVTVEGNISIKNVGQIAVTGLRVEEANKKIKAAIAKVYRSVATGQSEVIVSLTNVRTINIAIIGGQNPGNYSVSSFSTVFNALFLAGGPGVNGSYRNIELIRDNKLYKTIDTYSYLVSGDETDNVVLRSNDVIRIPAYTTRVTIDGQVKRPGIFEMKKGENLTKLLGFASGFNEVAYTTSINVTQNTEKGFVVLDIPALEFDKYEPKSGDFFRVSKILDRFQNRVSISGAVFRPNTYSLREGMKISDLISIAGGLKEDAYQRRIRILRQKADLTTEIIQTDLSRALAGDAEANIILNKEDVVTVYSILDFREEFRVVIDGEVKNPGVYTYHDNLTLNDLIIEAGGLKGGASKRVEIARMLKSENTEDMNSNSQLFNLEITPENNEQAKNFELKTYDVVSIRKMAVYELPEIVQVSGGVVYPGKYVLTNKKERIFDVIQRAGGLSSIADIEGVKIKRPVERKKLDEVKSVNVSSGVDNVKEDEKIDEIKYNTIPIHWDKVEGNPKSSANVILMSGDEIEVSYFTEGVKVMGNVVLNSEIVYKKGKGFKYYLSSVGGIDTKGWKKRAYIVYPNGSAAVTISFFFFKKYPKVKPGSQIVVPEKPERRRMTPMEWVGMTSALSTMGLAIFAAFK